MSIPDKIALKEPKDFKLIGTSAKRLDLPGKINGKVVFGIDVRLPGMKFATLAQSPALGGRVETGRRHGSEGNQGRASNRSARRRRCRGRRPYGGRKKALAVLTIDWDDGPHAKLDTGAVLAELDQATQKPGVVAQRIGDANAALVGAATRVDATYHVPFLAHATMEPMNCTVHMRPDACDIWVGTQAIARVQRAAAKVAGLPLDKVTVHNHLIGGGFGRRLESDGVERAVQIAKQVDGPVKVVWTREEDIQHDMYRPMFFDRLSAGLDPSGKPIVWSNRFAGSSIIARWLPPAFNNGLDPDTTEGAIDLVYDLPNVQVEYVRVEPPGIPTAFWRSVGPSHNVFVTEGFMDELAAAAGQDPVAYRLGPSRQGPASQGRAGARI